MFYILTLIKQLKFKQLCKFIQQNRFVVQKKIIQNFVKSELMKTNLNIVKFIKFSIVVAHIVCKYSIYDQNKIFSY